jgi:hypothetical protein
MLISSLLNVWSKCSAEMLSCGPKGKEAEMERIYMFQEFCSKTNYSAIGKSVLMNKV